MFAGIPDFQAELCRLVPDGDTTWSEWRWSGTRLDGQPFEMRGVTLFQIRDGQIVAGRLHMEDLDREAATGLLVGSNSDRILCPPGALSGLDY